MLRLLRLKSAVYSCIGVLFLFVSLATPAITNAQKSNDGFSLQVSPSPIVETVKPNEPSIIEVVIRNTGSHTEDLKMGVRSFKVADSGEVKLSDNAPKEVADWVLFSDPTFSVEAGKSFVQKVTFATPIDAGFSYSFALLVSRQKPTAAAPGKPAIEGSVAIFTLLSVDKPGATRKVDVLQFSSSKHVYEYLPATFSLRLKNSGNSILKPTGTIFVQRTASSKTPLSTVSINESGAYILPDVTRTISSDWNSGFPYYKVSENSEKKQLKWNFSEIDKFKIGRYFAKAIVVYNDGVRDVPVSAIISFWVIPWKLLLGLTVIILFICIGLYTTIHQTAIIASKKNREKPKS